MPKGPAARILDMTLHQLPGMLLPGPGSPNVFIGKKMAWRGIPLAAAAGLVAAKSASETRVAIATVATAAQAGSPTFPAAVAALEVMKAAEATAMAANIMAASGGADIHICVSVTPIPLPPPHGPGVVIDGSPTVLINNLPACRGMDTVLEAFGPPNKILLGEFTVIIGDMASHFTQQMSNSCVVASVRNMIRKETGRDVSEAELRARLAQISGNPAHNFETTPINPAFASQLLAEYGVPNTVRTNQSPADLENLTSDGHPVLVGFSNPGHRVMLDSVRTNPDGSKTYIVRDPDPAYGGQPREMSSTDFNNRYNQGAIVIDPNNPR